ncbi:MAG: ABC transporter permease [Planctomycetota bacterium]
MLHEVLGTRMPTMSFFSLCCRNVLRRRFRSTLTACAVAIAVAAVVALVGVSTGFRRDFILFYEGVGIDIMAVGRASIVGSAIDEAYADKVKRIEGVQQVIPGLLDTTAFPEKDLMYVPINGMEPGTMVFDRIEKNLVSGRLLRTSDGAAVMLGKTLAEALGKTSGDTVEIDGEPYAVVGVNDSFSVIEKGSIIMPLAQVQKHMRREGEITGLSVIADGKATAEDLDRIIAQIEAISPELEAQRARDHIENQPQIKLAVGMAWITSSIAIVVGGLGMLNTMLMSLQERIGEIGLLRAVGWTRRRIARMILAESVVLSLAGGFVGVLAAIGLVMLLSKFPAAKGFISGQIDLAVMLQGILLAVGVGVVGGAVPAWKATRLAPAEALRH